MTRSSNGAYANYLIGTAYRQMGELQKALPFLEDEEFRPTWRDDWSRELSAFHTGVSRMRANASGLVRKQKFRQAIPRLEEIIARDPTDQRSLNMLGTCYLQTKQWDKCLQPFETSLAVNDQHYISNLNYAAVLMSVRMHREVDLNVALRHADKAISLRPGSAKAHASKAMICQLLRNNQQAIESFAKSYELDSRTPTRAIQAAQIESSLGKLQQAAERLQAVLDVTEEHASVFIELANVRNSQAQFDQAYQLFLRALDAKNCKQSQSQFIRKKLEQLRAMGIGPASP